MCCCGKCKNKGVLEGASQHLDKDAKAGGVEIRPSAVGKKHALYNRIGFWAVQALKENGEGKVSDFTDASLIDAIHDYLVAK